MATCKDCIHSFVCRLEETKKALIKSNVGAENCCAFLDRYRCIELPCKVGVEVYVIPTYENARTEITKMLCVGFALGEPCDVANLVDDKNKLYQPSFEMFWETVFLSHEEAENALKEREGKRRISTVSDAD